MMPAVFKFMESSRGPLPNRHQQVFCVVSKSWFELFYKQEQTDLSVLMHINKERTKESLATTIQVLLQIDFDIEVKQSPISIVYKIDTERLD